MDMPAIPIPRMNLIARIDIRSSRKKLDTPQATKTRSDTDSVLTLPNLSATHPMANPVHPTARDGRVMMSDTAKSRSGNAWFISGSAGATAAPPISISIDARSSDSNVSLVGAKAPFSFPFMMRANVRMYI